jgi:hypothetical protein
MNVYLLVTIATAQQAGPSWEAAATHARGHYPIELFLAQSLYAPEKERCYRMEHKERWKCTRGDCVTQECEHYFRF